MKNTNEAGNTISGFCQNLSDGKIIIDSYQRNYEWGKEQWNDFFDTINDIITKERKREDKFYMGTILYYRDDKGCHICDGQQRLTTSILTILYIYNNFNDKLIARKCGIIFDDNDSVKIDFFNNNDKKGLENCTNNAPQKNNSKIDDYYIFLSNKLNDYPIERGMEIIDTVLTKFGFMFIEANDENEAIEMFNNQSKGKELSNEDKINAQLHAYLIGKIDSIDDIDIRKNIKNMVNDFYKTRNDKWFLNTFVAIHTNDFFKQKDVLSAMEILTEKYTNNDILDKLRRYVNDCTLFYNSEVKTNKFFNNDCVINLWRYVKYSPIKYDYKDELFQFFRNLIINTLIDKNKPGSIHVDGLLKTCFEIMSNGIEPCDYFTFIKDNAKKLVNELSLETDKTVIKENFITYNSYKNKTFAQFVLWMLEDKINENETGRIENPTLDHVSPQKSSLVTLVNSIGNLTILSGSSNSSKNNKTSENSFNEIHNSKLYINEYFNIYNEVNEYDDDEIYKRGEFIFTKLYDDLFNYNKFNN